MKIKIEEEYAIHPTPEDLAEEFWGMSEVEQAQFFNRLGEIADRLAMQLQAVTDSDELSIKGRIVMQRIGEYAEEQNNG